MASVSVRTDQMQIEEKKREEKMEGRNDGWGGGGYMDDKSNG